jgi:hypothetical protein
VAVEPPVAPPVADEPPVEPPVLAEPPVPLPPRPPVTPPLPPRPPLPPALPGSSEEELQVEENMKTDPARATNERRNDMQNFLSSPGSAASGGAGAVN